MSVQRWAEGFRGGGVRAVDGEWVTYADHVAALAEQASTELATAKEWLATRDEAWYEGYAEALRQAREAVIAECIAHHGYTPGQTCPYCTDALAAIDALRGGVVKPLPDKDGNAAGWWDDMYRFHPGKAVTHTRNSTPWDFCQECSDAAADWVRWPCAGVRSGPDARKA